MSKIVAIINVTPDSFSDGGKFFTPEAAIKQCAEAVTQGASVLDIGAESTRPNATPLPPQEEWQRLKNILPELVAEYKNTNIEISVDTRHPETAIKAIELGVDWINDVSGFDNPNMIEAVKNHEHIKVVVMHNLGVPANREAVLPDNIDVVQHIYDWANDKISQLMNSGISKNRIIFDVGIGFGKTSDQSFEIIGNIKQFKQLGVELYVGHSRKSFLNNVSKQENATRDIATLAVTAILAQHRVDYIRVHTININSITIDVINKIMYINNV
jgi:dihydropteroate synthase